MPFTARWRRLTKENGHGCSGLVSDYDQRYTAAMRQFMFSALVVLYWLPMWCQTIPADWKIIQDAKAACQMAVPPEWVPFGDNNGVAVLHDPDTAIAVVTSLPAQEFKPVTATLLKHFGVPKEKIFENSAVRLFYQDKTSDGPNDHNAFTASVPAKNGTCTCRVVVLPSVSADVAKKIVLSISPIPVKM